MIQTFFYWSGIVFWALTAIIVAWLLSWRKLEKWAYALMDDAEDFWRDQFNRNTNLANTRRFLRDWWRFDVMKQAIDAPTENLERVLKMWEDGELGQLGKGLHLRQIKTELTRRAIQKCTP